MLVENKAGADGAISGAKVMRAPSDGYTLFFATNSPMAVAPAMRKNPPYDPIRDFTPIADIGRYTFFVVVHPSVPAKTVAELLQHAKDNPGKLNYATGNTTGIMSTAQFAHLGGIRIVHVPYKGEPQALIDLIAGRVQFMVVFAGTSVQHIRDGKLRALAVITTKRSPVLPDVPTIAEAGVGGFLGTHPAGEGRANAGGLGGLAGGSAGGSALPRGLFQRRGGGLAGGAGAAGRCALTRRAVSGGAGREPDLCLSRLPFDLPGTAGRRGGGGQRGSR